MGSIEAKGGSSYVKHTMAVQLTGCTQMCRPLEKVLIVELEQNKPETMLEQYQAFISAEKICF